jgi:DNA-binding CsgD family transcriptional regulator
MAAAELWATIGCPYERAIALSHGDPTAQLEALEILESLEATAVAAKLRKAMRGKGLSVPRGKGRRTRAHAAGLTHRQAEVLQLLGEDLTNPEIADRLFVSPRTVGHHVSAVLTKLDSCSREEAVSRVPWRWDRGSARRAAAAPPLDDRGRLAASTLCAETPNLGECCPTPMGAPPMWSEGQPCDVAPETAVTSTVW